MKRFVVLFTSLAAIIILVFITIQLLSNDISAREMRALEEQSLVVKELVEEKSTHRQVVHRLVNNTDDDVIYGLGFVLYVRRSNGWRLVPVDEYAIIGDTKVFRFVPSIAIGLPSHGYTKEPINIYNGLHGRLPPGEYRIVRTVSRRVFVSQRVGYVFEELTVVGRFTIP